MKALIAAGGRATRLRPITWTINKHLIPLANRPMLVHAIQKIVEAGITDIYVNVNPGETETMRAALGDGSAYGAQLTYLEQQGGPRGIAHAVANAAPQLQDGPFLFYLGDNVLLGSIKHLRERFEREQLDCLIGLSRVTDPSRFGVAEFFPDGRLKGAVEKPKNPPSDFAITGIYFFSPDYFKAFPSFTPSARGEYEITEAISWFIKNGKAGHEEITGWWKDTGTPEAILEGNAAIMDDLPASAYKIEGDVGPGARVEGLVSIGRGSRVTGHSHIRGPAMIGENCVIENADIAPYTCIGNGATLRNARVEYSLIFENVSIETSTPIAKSLLGRGARILAKPDASVPSHRLLLGDNSSVEL